jgi:hypothetical protein
VPRHTSDLTTRPKPDASSDVISILWLRAGTAFQMEPVTRDRVKAVGLRVPPMGEAVVQGATWTNLV